MLDCRVRDALTDCYDKQRGQSNHKPNCSGDDPADSAMKTVGIMMLDHVLKMAS